MTIEVNAKIKEQKEMLEDLRAWRDMFHNSFLQIMKDGSFTEIDNAMFKAIQEIGIEIRELQRHVHDVV